MNTPVRTINRRAFLRGACGVSIALPFLESLPGRSAWAQGDDPMFALFIGTANGVVADQFWPSQDGPLTGLAEDPNAAGILADFAERLIFVQGLKYPGLQSGCSHSQSYCQMYTGAPSEGGGNTATSTAPSIDTILARSLNPDGLEPMALYSGMKAGYINERLSFIDAGQVRAAQGDPKQAYQDLLMLLDPLSSVDQQDGQAAVDELMLRRRSAVDLVRDELQTLRGRSGLSAADDARIEHHLSALRDVEAGVGELGGAMGTGSCREQFVDVEAIDALGETYRANGMVEKVAALQMQIIALAFACNANRIATLQWGDGQDNTVYDVPSNERRWTFHHISHRVQSDGASGNDVLAEQAHAEIDRVRLETFRDGLQRFDDHGLLDKSIVMWANQISDGPSGSFYNLPTILAGNPGGALASGQHLRLSSGVGDFGIGATVENGRLLTTIAQVMGVDENIGVSEGIIDELLA